MRANAKKLIDQIHQLDMNQKFGNLISFNGLVIESNGPDAKIGELCELMDDNGAVVSLAEVIGFKNEKVLLMPFEKVSGISGSSPIRATGKSLTIPVGNELLGRVVDAFCMPIDEIGEIKLNKQYSVYRKPVNPLAREEINSILETGIAAIDAMLTMGKGQRMGIMAGSGVGKSTLLGMMGRHVNADVIVLALVGERGREVADFINHSLGKEGLSKSVVIVATSDQPALVRTHAVRSAHAVAEYFSDQGKSVLLIVDSITRFALAQREIGLSAGEPPTFRGYTPSVFSSLPSLVERCGNFKSGGSITAVYSVLVEGDDMNEPIADHMRSLLDGHIVLSRELAARSQFPSIDILQSTSRLINQLTNNEESKLIRKTRKMLSIYESSKDMIELGAHQIGINLPLDIAIKNKSKLDEIFSQLIGESFERTKVLSQLNQLMEMEV